jgi:hypothetical protein
MDRNLQGICSLIIGFLLTDLCSPGTAASSSFDVQALGIEDASMPSFGSLGSG